MSNTEQTINNAYNSMKQMNDSTITVVTIVITLTIVLVAILYYLYYTFLKGRESSIFSIYYGELNGKIKSIDSSDQFNYTFKDYYIKSAYNCCSGGNYKNGFVDTSILKNLLKQGVRGLDFEIYSIDDQPIVATSTTDNYHVKETFNYIRFADVMSIIRDYAFASSTSPNPSDPIILHLRIKSTNQAMYKNFAQIFKSFNTLMLGEEYSFENHKRNFGDVELRLLMGKIVVIVERDDTAFMECKEFYEYVNMTSNSVFMRALHYYDIKYSPDIKELTLYNKQNMTIGMPDKGVNPENPSPIVLRETGCQLLAMRYQTVDSNLEANELFFYNNGYAFVLKPEPLRYIPVTIPLPPPQNPELSYATRTVQSDFYKFEI